MTEHSSMRVATSRQQQALIRREQIIEAAITLFAQQGFDGTSTRQIAGSIGITEGLNLSLLSYKGRPTQCGTGDTTWVYWGVAPVPGSGRTALCK